MGRAKSPAAALARRQSSAMPITSALRMPMAMWRESEAEVDSRVVALRRLIDLYREYLRAGVDRRTASIYLRRIREIQDEILSIEGSEG